MLDAVIKIGSSLLETSDKKMDTQFLEDIASQVSHLFSCGKRVVIVSSGATLCGLIETNTKKVPNDIISKQVLCSIGQPILMSHWREAFSKYSLRVGQILLTYDDFGEKERKTNARNTILFMLKQGTVPIINENDTVAVDEIKLGDNDFISAYVSALCDSKKLILLSNVKGVYDERGSLLKIIENVRELTKKDFIRKSRWYSRASVGGMLTKLESAGIASMFGISTYIVNGRDKNVITDIVLKDTVEGTFIPPKKIFSKALIWIGKIMKPKGKILIDDGAEKALLTGKSLLPSGIKDVYGEFSKGDAVVIVNEKNEEICHGIVNYSSVEINIIKGKNSKEIEKLGIEFREAIHRNKIFFSNS